MNSISLTKLQFSILVFLFSYGLLYVIHPRFIFKKDGSLRQFGLGSTSKTILPLWLISILIAILSYLIDYSFVSRFIKKMIPSW